MNLPPNPIGPWSPELRLACGYGYRVALCVRTSDGGSYTYRVTFDGQEVARDLTCRGLHGSPGIAIECAIQLIEELRYGDAQKALSYIEDHLAICKEDEEHGRDKLH